jgi:hypothetical protein
VTAVAVVRSISTTTHDRRNVASCGEIRKEIQDMVYRGHVEHGVVRLEGAPALPEGVQVEVRLLAEDTSQAEEPKVCSVCETLKDFVGKAEGLPADASINLDHYLYGLPKRQ